MPWWRVDAALDDGNSTPGGINIYSDGGKLFPQSQGSSIGALKTIDKLEIGVNSANAAISGLIIASRNFNDTEMADIMSNGSEPYAADIIAGWSFAGSLQDLYGNHHGTADNPKYIQYSL